MFLLPPHLSVSLADVCSPYSYLGFHLAHRLMQLPGWKDSVRLELRPVFLGGIMKSSGNTPPAKNPAKGRFLGSDLRLQAAYFGVPYRMPSNFWDTVTSSLGAQRLLMAATLHRSPKEVEKVTMSMLSFSLSLSLS